MASWNHDGTQDPGPPPLMSDPLSGLVTGGKFDAEAVRIRVVEPAAPDIEAVRTAMESVLDENSELRIDLPNPLAAKPAPAKPAEKAAPDKPVEKAPTPTPPAGIPAPATRMGATPLEIPSQRRLVIVMLASLIDTISAIFS